MCFQARWLSGGKSGVAFAPRCQLRCRRYEMRGKRPWQAGPPAPGTGWPRGTGQRRGGAGMRPRAEQPPLGLKPLEIVVELLSGFSRLLSFCFWVCVFFWGEVEGGEVSYAPSILRVRVYSLAAFVVISRRRLPRFGDANVTAQPQPPPKAGLFGGEGSPKRCLWGEG